MPYLNVTVLESEIETNSFNVNAEGILVNIGYSDFSNLYIPKECTVRLQYSTQPDFTVLVNLDEFE